MIDIHNHLQDPRLKPHLAAIIPAMKKAGLTRCVCNGTSPADWSEVANLADEHPDFIIPAFGLHPWKVAQAPTNWQKTLRSFLDKYPQALIGECGLDRWIENPDLPAQQKAFRFHLELAHELRRPITIHCLKAWGPLLDALEEIPLPPRALLHSYGGSIEFAEQVRQKHDPWFSFSGYFLQERKKESREGFPKLPADRILLETDAPDMLPPPDAISHPLPDELNHPANLPEIAKKLLAKHPGELDLTRLNQNAACFLDKF